MPDKVRGRFAPSPSGRMHLGNVASALLGWLSARSKGGEFLLRLEDLDERTQDPQRSDQIIDDLSWLGLGWDGDPVRQSAHVPCYEDALQALCNRAEVYECFCSRADLHVASAPHADDGSSIYAGTCRSLSPGQRAARAAVKDPALRIHVPCRDVGFEDGHMGAYAQNLASGCGDFVIRRSDGVFAYQLVCVVDDAMSGITEVVRGSDLLPSTPRQIFLQELLGYGTPSYCHHPLLVDHQGRRLSKRDKDYDLGCARAKGARPEQVLGWLACALGLVEEYEPCAAQELLAGFSWGRVRHGNVCAYDEGMPWE